MDGLNIEDFRLVFDGDMINVVKGVVLSGTACDICSHVGRELLKGGNNSFSEDRSLQFLLILPHSIHIWRIFLLR